MHKFKITGIEMTAQEVFDKAVIGILEQGVPSMSDSGTCKYRGPNGLKCAAGQVLRDEDYVAVNWDRDTNDSSFDTIVNNGDAPDYMFQHQELISDLQTAHDSDSGNASDPEGVAAWLQDFRREARAIAKQHRLRMPKALYKRNDAKEEATA